MAIFVILLIISALFVLGGFGIIKEIYEGINERLATKPSQRAQYSTEQKIYYVVGAAIIIIGVVLYFIVCASAIKNIIAVKHPVKAPIPYGISAIITSLIFNGGLYIIMCAYDLDDDCFYDRNKRAVIICLSAVAVLLVTYLALKAFMILP